MQYYMPRKYPQKVRAVTPGTKYSVAMVWAAAIAAHRINDNRYVKTPEWDTEAEPPVIKYRTSREVFAELLANPDRLDAGDIQAGQECLDWVRGDFTVKALKGQLSDFDLSVQKVIAVETEFDSNLDRLALAVVPLIRTLIRPPVLLFPRPLPLPPLLLLLLLARVPPRKMARTRTKTRV